MLSNIGDAVADFREGKFVIVLDDENRENEGDLIVAAEKISPEKINFMVKYARGLVCLPILGSRLEELNIPQMVEDTSFDEPAFTITIDHRNSGTGISAPSRAYTIEKVLDKESKGEDFVRPGHIFPLKAREGGVLEREGHTEAAIDLARLVGMYPAGVICEILNEDGSMARYEDLIEYSFMHKIKIISIKDLKEYILARENKFMKESILI